MLSWKPVCLFWLTLELVTQAWLPWTWFLLLGAWLFIMQTQVCQAEYYLVFNKVTLTRPWSPLRWPKICGAGPASLGDTIAQIEFLIIVTILCFNIQWLLCSACCLLSPPQAAQTGCEDQLVTVNGIQERTAQHSTLAVHTMQDKAGQNQAPHVYTPKRSRTRDSMAGKCPLPSGTPVETGSLFCHLWLDTHGRC